MTAMDEVNSRFSRLKAVHAMPGFKRSWKARSESRSPGVDDADHRCPGDSYVKHTRLPKHGSDAPSKWSEVVARILRGRKRLASAERCGLDREPRKRSGPDLEAGVRWRAGGGCELHEVELAV